MRSLPVVRNRELDNARGRRKRSVRATTVSPRSITQRDLAVGLALYPVTDHGKPATRGDCGEERPCPFVSCKYHLAIDVTAAGGLRLNFPDLEIDEMAETCVLDVADRDGVTLEAVGGLMNLTRERVRQIEVAALDKVLLGGSLRDFAGEGHAGKRRLPVIEDEEAANG